MSPVTKLLGVNERAVYRMAQAKQLLGFKVEGTWRFLEADVGVDPGTAKAGRCSCPLRKSRFTPTRRQALAMMPAWPPLSGRFTFLAVDACS
jgi:hypothetical protein